MPAEDSIHTAVRQHYGNIAAASRAGSSCCGPATDCCSGGYSAEDLNVLPESVTDLSLGCGNPIVEARIQAGETVLDLGSGGGIDCFLAAERTGPSGRVIGVDMTPEMLERARTNAAKLKAHNVEFREGRIEAMPVEDGSIDVVVSNCVINLSPDKPQVFREMHRALKPGGRIAVADIVTHGPMSGLVAKSLEAWAGCIAGALDMKDYRGGLLAAGFTDVHVTPKDGTANKALSSLPIGMPFSALITARKPQ